MKIRIHAIAKNEAPYFAEWIFHHFYFGIDAISILVNNTKDNSYQVLQAIKSEHPNLNIELIEGGDELYTKSKRLIPPSNGWKIGPNMPGYFFQRLAYTEAHNDAWKKGFTHQMFIDLDEFWTPKNFLDKIPDVVRKYDCDSLCFPWAIDHPFASKESFSDVYDSRLVARKNGGLKSLYKISSKVEEIAIRNHFIRNGKFKVFHSDGPVNESTAIDNFPVRQPKVPYEYFTYHKIFRSKKEYIASLSRGGPWVQGHFIDRHIHVLNYEPFEIVIDPVLIEKYNSAYEKFLTDPIKKELKISQDRVLQEYEKNFQIIKSNGQYPQLIGRYYGE